MTGIVVVSHSRALAEAAVALASEMASGVRVEVAAGLDDGGFGTDATAILTAMQAADQGSGGPGVVVLMDLGSAVLSAQMALELLDPGLAERVVLCAAPFVEGLVVAVVAAGGGAPPAKVAAEASRALEAKRDQVGVEDAAPDLPPGPQTTTAGVTGEFELRNPHGLHARPAARMVAEAQRLSANGLILTLRNVTTGAGPAEADSMLGVMTLGAERGHRVEVIARGEGAQAAVDAVLALAERDFDES